MSSGSLARSTITGGIAFAVLVTFGFSAQAQISAYPAQGQTAEQQSRDRYECHTWAVQQSGFDPMAPQAQTYAQAAPQFQARQGELLRGAARGATIGAVGGAIGGDAGKGAAIGAATGALFGGFRRLDRRRQQQSNQQYQQQQMAQAQGQRQQGYNQAMAACLQGRGYSFGN